MAAPLSRLGPGGVGGLASSLRSQTSAAAASVLSPGTNQGNNTNNSYYHNENNDIHNYRQYGRDAIVPDSDDSTEEDEEEYNAYLQEQEQQQKQAGSSSSVAQAKSVSIRQLLHDDDPDTDHSMDEDGEYQEATSSTSTAQGSQAEIQARQNQILGSEDEDEDMDEDDEDDDASTSTVSLTEDDIDFNLVYAFHTFVATQEGQASVVRNDSLMLLEDTNVYWWLVRVLKTGVIGYIPAENIETPFERLARLNKYRNVGLSAPTAEFGTFDEPIKSLDPSTLGERSMNRRSVIFTAQNEYFGASENEWDDEDDEEGDDDEMGEYYEGREDEEEGQTSDDQQNRQEEKSALQLEAERVQQEILQDQKQQQKSHYDYDSESGREDEYDDEPVEEEPVTNRFRRNLLDDDDLMFDAEPRKISLTPSIARDEPATSSGIVNSLRSGSNSRAMDSPQQHQQRPSDGYRSPSFDSEEEERQRQQNRQLKEAKLNAILDDDKTQSRENDSSQAQDLAKKAGKVKSLFGFGKSSKEKEKERKEKERLDREKLKNTMTSNNNGDGNIGALRNRPNSNGSIGSFGTGQSGQSGGALSPASANESSDTLQKEIVALRVYPGNVDFGVSMYKTVVVSQTTLASEVASQAVVKFKLAPEGVSSSNAFYLSVRGVDGDEIVLQPTDKPLAIYQSLTAHLTTPLPPNHRLSISSVSSMMSVNSTSSYASITPSTPTTPTSPSHVRRVGSGRSDPHQRSIRFLLNKKIRRPGSTSSMPSTPTTPTAPIQEDFFWVKVVCMAQDLPQTMLLVDGMGTALDRADPRAQGQMTGTKVEHWIPMHATSNAGDVIFKALQRIGIRAGVVDGVPEHILASKRNSAPNGLVIEYQLGVRLNGQTSPRARQGDELPLAPQVALSRCYDEHQLVPVRRSPKADVASMPPNPDHLFFLRKSSKSVQAEMNFAAQEASLNGSRQQSKKVPAPLQARSLRSPSSEFNDSPKSPVQQSPTSASGMASPRSLRSLRSFEDASDPHQHGTGPLSPGFNRTNGTSSPSQSDIRIPRRGDSVAMGPNSPIRTNSHENLSRRPSPTMQNHQQHGRGSRTPTPDLHNSPGMAPHMGRNRSPSVSQGLRPGQAPSPSPSSHTDHDGSRSSTPDRPARPERPERQRAISPPMTHGPSPLSLSAVMLQGEDNGNQSRHLHPHQQQSLSVDDIQVNGRPLAGSSSTSDSMIAPLNIKKNATQGLDIVLSKGVIRSSRLMPSKQYRYSFIPSEGGEEVDISEIIEDILGEEHGGDDDDQEYSQEGALRQLNGGNDEPRRINPGAVAARSMSNSSRTSRNGAQSDRDRLEVLGTSARGGDTLMKLEKVLAMDLEGESTASARNQNTGIGYGNRANRRDMTSPVPSAQPTRTLASPLSLRSSSPAHNHKRDSDVEIQVASVASLSTRSASPMITEPPSRPFAGQDNGPGSPRTMRSASPFGVMAKGTLLSNSTNGPSARARSPSVSQSRSASPSSPSPSSAAGMAQENNAGARSFSPIPRRLQSPSPAPRQQSPMGNDYSKTNGVSSAAPSARSNSGSSATSITQRNRSASTSATETNPRYGANKGHVSPNSGKDQWLLSSDYNAGMQDLLTLVRAGRSSSVSSSPMRGGGPLIGKDGKIVPLPSTIKASLISASSRDLLGAKSTSSSSDTPNQGNNHHDTKNGSTNHDTNDKKQQQHDDYPRAKSPAELEQVRRMMVMLNELTLKDVQEECHPDVYECWKDVDADLDRVERELDDLLVTVKASIL
ncbi:hypothetical protein BGZ74_003981 [Mortierella antarctica]|nr:hypothetical protein BGZ74_003981 [Mortierella antarctica]